MTVPSTIDAAGWLGKFLEADDTDVDLPRAMLQAFAEALMSAQASAQCGASYRGALRGAGELPERVSAPAVGYPGGYDRSGGARSCVGGCIRRSFC